MQFAQIVHRLVSDTTFGAQFRQNPTAALATSGYSLTSNEISALVTLFSNESEWSRLISTKHITPRDLKWYLS